MEVVEYPESYTLEDLRWMCDCAKRVLIAEHGYRESDFGVADGDEVIYTPSRSLVHADCKHNTLWQYVEPLPGTVLVWNCSGGETPEWDCCAAISELVEIEFWKDFEPSPDDLSQLVRPS